jgi:hypothetical protein
MLDVIIYPCKIRGVTIQVIGDPESTEKPDLFGVYNFDPVTMYTWFLFEWPTPEQCIAECEATADIETIYISQSTVPHLQTKDCIQKHNLKVFDPTKDTDE